MSALAKLKKQAAQHEHDRQYDKSLALYARLIDETSDDEMDVAVFNRAGDVAFRAGDADRAIGYYERALDLYAAGGLLNNAIALGAKILRQAPERAATHYTLGVLHAKKGFRSDARQHFLTYAERMQRGGQAAEVARSLADYVVLCDGAADARAGLAAHLAVGGPRPSELGPALAELLEQALRAAGQLDAEEGADAEGRGGPAARAKDPFGNALVFLDLDAAAREDAAAGTGDAPIATLDLLDPSGFDAADEPPPALTLEPASGPLASLPGELPPLLPSLVALDGSRDEPDGAAWAPADPLGDHALLDLAIDDAPDGVPAFADEDDGLVMLDMGTGVAAHDDADGDDAPAAALHFVDLDAPDDVLPEAPTVGSAWPIVAEAPAAPALLDLDDALVDAPAPAPAVVEVVERAVVAAPTAGPTSGPADDGVDLGDWLREHAPAPTSTRLVAPVLPTTGDEEADFQATLQAFKAGIARTLHDADFDAHYDLGVAYREMGLLDEAIGEFQKAARTPDRPLRALEALAGCFLERAEPELVLSTLSGVAGELADAAPLSTAEAPSHVALCYLLGAASQDVGRVDDARRWFLRVLAIDYQFRDAAGRLASLSPSTR